MELQLILGGAVLLVAARALHTRIGVGRARVVAVLARLDVSDVAVAVDWKSLRIETCSFKVQYRTPDGHSHRNRARVLLGDSGLVSWDRVPEGRRRLGN